jgi:catalase
MATTPETFVDALNLAFGKQTTQRSAHAKGVVLLGKFVPSAEAVSVSKALHFKHEVPVTVRFSANSGIPKIADADPRAAPRGLAIRFEWVTRSVSLPSGRRRVRVEIPGALNQCLLSGLKRE